MGFMMDSPGFAMVLQWVFIWNLAYNLDIRNTSLSSKTLSHMDGT